MLIGELSEKTGFSKDTIRFYEKKKLIILDNEERRDNNYKEYSNQVFERLIMIKVFKKLGFTLNEIINLLEFWEGNKNSCDILVDKIHNKINIIDKEINILNNVKIILNDILGSCNNKCDFDNKIPSCITKCS